MSKISGPLLDRIDIHIELPSVKYKELSDIKDAEPSRVIKERVEKTRAIQRKRFETEGIFYNAQMNTKLIKKYCVLEDEAKELLKMAMTELGLWARAYDKLLKASRTIADLAVAENIKTEHLTTLSSLLSSLKFYVTVQNCKSNSNKIYPDIFLSVLHMLLAYY